MAYWILALTILTGAVFAAPPRIIGGEETSVEEYPSLVQVEYMDQWSGMWWFWCGANVLTTRTLLSAAHCFDGRDYSPEFRRIRAGATYRGTGGQVHYIIIAHNHPTYNQASYMDGDINLVRLMTPLIYSPVVAQTQIYPQGTLIPDNLPVVYAGWGNIAPGGPLAEALRDVTVSTVNNTLCGEMYELAPRGPVPITRNMICAGLVGVGGKDACGGDSGGPLYYGNTTIGIVAFGEGCALPDFPGVNTAVAMYTDWIIANTI